MMNPSSANLDTALNLKIQEALLCVESTTSQDLRHQGVQLGELLGKVILRDPSLLVGFLVGLHNASDELRTPYNITEPLARMTHEIDETIED